MTKKQIIYHFLDPEFAYPFVEHFYKVGFKKEVELILVFSSKNFKPRRRKWNPLKVLDTFSAQTTKIEIIKKYKPFGFPIKFVSNVNQQLFIDTISKNTEGICTGFNQIFKKELINKFKEFVNIHPSLLPFYRGPTPIEWCLANQEKYTGWTLHQINENIDDGKILYQEVIEIKTKSVKEIKTEITNNAKLILYDFLKTRIDKKEFLTKKIDPDTYYFNKVNYKSFYKPLN